MMIRTVLKMKAQTHRHQRHHDQCLELRGRHCEKHSSRDHANLPENNQDFPVEMARMEAGIEELVLTPYILELGDILRAEIRFLKSLKVLTVPEKEPKCPQRQSKDPHDN